MKKEAAGYILECDGTNDGDEGVIARFRMEGVQVGEKDGEPTMAPVVVPADAVTAGERLVANMNRTNKVAFDVLVELYGDGAPVPMALWRAKCRDAFDEGDTTMDALNKKFDRAKKALVENGKAAVVDDGFIPVG